MPLARARLNARRVVEERLGLGVARELALLQPAHEHGAEAARADRERVGDQHRALDRPLTHRHAAERLEQLLARARQRRLLDRERAQLGAASRSAPAASASAAASGASTAAARRCGAVQIASASATSASRNVGRLLGQLEPTARPGRGGARGLARAVAISSRRT